jgi:hypothetical protein
MTYYCPTCDRYLIRRGAFYLCFFCLGRRAVDPEAIGKWRRTIIEGLVR